MLIVTNVIKLNTLWCMIKKLFLGRGTGSIYVLHIVLQYKAIYNNTLYCNLLQWSAIQCILLHTALQYIIIVMGPFQNWRPDLQLFGQMFWFFHYKMVWLQELSEVGREIDTAIVPYSLW